MVQLELATTERSQAIDITAKLKEAASRLGIRDGVLHVFCPHTTAGLLINENADPAVEADILAHLERMVPWDGPWRHAEGNAAAHVKASLVGQSVWVPVEHGRLQLGRWQGVFFCEFDGPRRRTVRVQALESPSLDEGALRR